MLKTERLELIGFDEKYAKDLLEVWSDFEVVKYTYTPLSATLEESLSYIQHRINRVDKDFTDAFIIVRNEKAIGIAGCTFMDKEAMTFGLYYQLSRKYWGYGYASEAAEALMQYVLNMYPKATILADAVSLNPSSIAVLRKIGLKQVGIEKNGFKRNGFQLDLVNFSNHASKTVE